MAPPRVLVIAGSDSSGGAYVFTALSPRLLLSLQLSPKVVSTQLKIEANIK